MNKICLERNKLALINVFMLRKKVQWKNLQEQKILTRNLYKKCFKCMCVMCVCVGVVVKMLSGVEGCLKALVVSVAGAPSTIHCSLHHTSFFIEFWIFFCVICLRWNICVGGRLTSSFSSCFKLCFYYFFVFLLFFWFGSGSARATPYLYPNNHM